MLITLFEIQVNTLVAATLSELSQIARDRQIKAAVERYSIDRPSRYSTDVTGNAKKYYAVATVLTKWIEGFSHIEQIEYPATALLSLTTQQPQYLERDDWVEDYWVESESARVRYLYLPNHTPAVADLMRIVYSIPWTWVASTTTIAVTQNAHGFVVGDYIYTTDGTTYTKATDITIATHKVTIKDTNTFTAAVLQTDTPQGDFFAVCFLAAAFCCYEIAAKYSEIGDTTLSADSGSHTSKAGEYQTRGDKYMSLYREHMRLDAEQVIQATGEFVAWGEEGREWAGDSKQVTHGGSL